MQPQADVYALLRLYAARNKTFIINFSDFCSFAQRYAKHYLEQNPGLSEMAEKPDFVVTPKVIVYAREGRCSLQSDDNRIFSITLPQYFLDVLTAEYRKIDENPEIPFPDEETLNLKIPVEWVRTVSIDGDLAEIVSKPSVEGSSGPVLLYRINFSAAMKPLIIPVPMVPRKLAEICILKVRQYLRKGANKEYIVHKLAPAFQNSKDTNIKDAMNAILTKPTEALTAMSDVSNDFVFPFWAYLFNFIKADINKKTDPGVEDLSLLQAINLLEFFNNYYKGRAQRAHELDSAYKMLDAAFMKPPLHFTMDQVRSFTDQKGASLLGIYTEERLLEYLDEKTHSNKGKRLPDLLLVHTSENTKYYIARERLLPLVAKLLADSRKELRAQFMETWYKTIDNYDTCAAMEDDDEFRKELESKLLKQSPLLEALLRSRLIVVAYGEIKESKEHPPELEKLFRKGELLPIDELLLLTRKGLLSDVRILLPFWHSMPIVCSLVLFFRKLSSRKGEAKKAKAPAQVSIAAQGQTKDQGGENQGMAKKIVTNDVKDELKAAAMRIERGMVSKGSSIDESLKILENRWNTLLNVQAKEDLTEDVNSLVRDYLRKVIKTLRAQNFTPDRLKTLAATLADTQTLGKIKNHAVLEDYIQLYLVKLVLSIK